MRKHLSRSKENAYVEIDGTKATLYSYNTPILEVEGNELTKVYPAWDYSSTTVKHRNLFIQEYDVKYGGVNLATLSNAALKGLLQKIEKGEARRLSINSPYLSNPSMAIPKELKTHTKTALTSAIVDNYSRDNANYYCTVHFTIQLKIPNEALIANVSINLEEGWVTDLTINDIEIMTNGTMLMPDDDYYEDIANYLVNERLKTVLFKTTVLRTDS